MRAPDRPGSAVPRLARSGYLAVLVLACAGCGARSELRSLGVEQGDSAAGAQGCGLPRGNPMLCPTGAATLVTRSGGVVVSANVRHIVYATYSPGARLVSVTPDGRDERVLHRFDDRANQGAWAQHGGVVYLNDSLGHLLRIPVDGAAVTTLYTAPMSFRAWSLAADGEWIYWGERDNRAGRERLFRLRESGGTPEMLAEVRFTWGYTTDFSPNQTVDVVVDGCSLYWLHQPTIPAGGGTNRDGAIHRVPKAGGAAVALLSGLADPYALASSRDAIWVHEGRESSWGEDDRLLGIDRNGTRREVDFDLAPGEYGVQHVLVGDDAVYYVRGGNSTDHTHTGWWRLALDGGSAPELIATATVGRDGPLAATLDPVCGMMYSVVSLRVDASDLVRQPVR